MHISEAYMCGKSVKCPGFKQLFFFSALLSPDLSSLLERLALDLVLLRSGEGGEYESPVGKSPIILALEGQGGS